jgi:hypothetical protein
MAIHCSGRFYKIAPESTALYLIPFALGNVLGPLLLGPLAGHLKDYAALRNGETVIAVTAKFGDKRREIAELLKSHRSQVNQFVWSI